MVGAPIVSHGWWLQPDSLLHLVRIFFSFSWFFLCVGFDVFWLDRILWGFLVRCTALLMVICICCSAPLIYCASTNIEFVDVLIYWSECQITSFCCCDGTACEITSFCCFFKKCSCMQGSGASSVAMAGLLRFLLPVKTDAAKRDGLDVFFLRAH